jgi:predicted RNA-binding Zn-ribbon protein involved in translation (DUF1610 family)
MVNCKNCGKKIAKARTVPDKEGNVYCCYACFFEYPYSELTKKSGGKK